MSKKHIFVMLAISKTRSIWMPYLEVYDGYYRSTTIIIDST